MLPNGFSALRSAAIMASLLVLAPAALEAAPLRGVIEARVLEAMLGQKSLVVLDIRSGETREKGKAVFEAGHVPGAVHVDYAHASWRLPRDKVSVYLPEPAQFEALAGDHGVSNDSDIVIVHEGDDATSFGGAARVYWSFKAMGHASVAILDGGWRGWTANPTRRVEAGASAPSPAIYEANPVPALRAGLEDVLAAEKSGAVLVDSRPESFFTGLEKHRAVAGFGHIPGAVNVPHSRALDASFKLRDKASLSKEFAAAINGKSAIAYCNTGHWGATDWFVLSEILDQPNVRLYDGSMLEYTAEKRGPVVNLRAKTGS